MLIKRSNGYIKITFRNVQEDEKNGTFEDVFALTGIKVLNTINSSFEFKNGKIIQHSDRFFMWAWLRQALAWKVLLLGWTPFLKAKIQKQAINHLMKFRKKN